MRTLFVEYNRIIWALNGNLGSFEVTHYEEKNPLNFSPVLAYWDLNGREWQINRDTIRSYWVEDL